MQIDYSFDDNSEIIKAAAKDAVERALTAAGLHLQGEAADELENDPRRVDTGRLKSSIAYYADDSEVVVGTNVEYAIYVHEGTRKMAPNRFLKNAFDRNIEQVKAYIVNELKSS